MKKLLLYLFFCLATCAGYKSTYAWPDPGVMERAPVALCLIACGVSIIIFSTKLLKKSPSPRLEYSYPLRYYNQQKLVDPRTGSRFMVHFNNSLEEIGIPTKTIKAWEL